MNLQPPVATILTAATSSCNLKFVEAIHGDKLLCIFEDDKVTISFLNSISENSKNVLEKREVLVGVLKKGKVLFLSFFNAKTLDYLIDNQAFKSILTNFSIKYLLMTNNLSIRHFYGSITRFCKIEVVGNGYYGLPKLL
jgi:hypothetical protein